MAQVNRVPLRLMALAAVAVAGSVFYFSAGGDGKIESARLPEAKVVTPGLSKSAAPSPISELRGVEQPTPIPDVAKLDRRSRIIQPEGTAVAGASAVPSPSAVTPVTGPTDSPARPSPRAESTPPEDAADANEVLPEAPEDLAPHEIEYVVVTVDKLVVDPSELVTFTFELCCDPSLGPAVEDVHLWMPELGSPRRMQQVRLHHDGDDLEFAISTVPIEHALREGIWGLSSVEVFLRGGSKIPLHGDQVRADSPLLTIKSKLLPLEILDVKFVPESIVLPDGAASVVVRTNYQGQGQGTLEIDLAKADAEKVTRHSMSVVELPIATVPTRFAPTAESAGVWNVEQVAVSVPDGRRAIWGGPKARLEVRYEGEDAEPLRAISIRFEPSIAAPGETVQIIVEIEGDGVAPEQGGIMSGSATCRLTQDRSEEVMLRRSSDDTRFTGPLTIPDTLTSGVVTIEGLHLGAFAGAGVHITRKDEPGLFRGVELTVQ